MGADLREQLRPVLAQCLVAHEQAEMPSGCDVAVDLLLRGGGECCDREHLIRWSDVVTGPGEQLQRHREVRQVHVFSADPHRPADEGVVAEQVLDDPQVEAAGDVLRVLEPVLELGVSGEVGRVVEMLEQVKLPADLRARLDQHETGEHVLALEHAAVHRDERLVEREIAAWGEMLDHLVDDRLAGVEVDRRACQRQGVDALGMQCGVDRRQPAALAVADQIDAAAAVLDRHIDDVEVVVDRGVLGLVGRPLPVERERPPEPARP